MRGKIKSLPAGKPFGFIKPDEGAEDVLFLIRELPKGRTPNVGDALVFEKVPGREPGKYKAANIKYAVTTMPAQAAATGAVPSQVPPSQAANQPNPGSNRQYFGPRDTLAAVNVNAIDNYELKINKMARWDGDKFKFFKTDKGRVLFEIQGDFKGIDFAALEARSKAATAAMENYGWEFKALDFTPDWRLIIGIGNESVYETGITLHHIYGCPFIPGQAVKGVTRSWIICEIFGRKENGELDLKKAEERALQNKVFCHLFGSPPMASKEEKSAIGEHQGSIIFWDALPVTAPKIEVDVMNPHYGDYYQGNSWPVDYLKTNPIYFLTVDHDSNFRLRLGVKAKENKKLSEIGDDLFAGEDGLTENSTLLEVALVWCRKAMSDHGIGAKTAVGYGYAAV